MRKNRALIKGGKGRKDRKRGGQGNVWIPEKHIRIDNINSILKTAIIHRNICLNVPIEVKGHFRVD